MEALVLQNTTLRLAVLVVAVGWASACSDAPNDALLGGDPHGNEDGDPKDDPSPGDAGIGDDDDEGDDAPSDGGGASPDVG